MLDQGQSNQPKPQNEPQQPTAQAGSPGQPVPARAPAGDPVPQAPGRSGYGATVRGQIQRVRVDLLSRETQRLDRTLQQIVEQQQEDQRWRDHWQSRFSELSGRVDDLLDETTRVAATAAAGQEVKETVKPLLRAVLEMLDHGAERSGATTDAMAGLAPTLRDLNAAAESLQQGTESEPGAPEPTHAPAAGPEARPPEPARDASPTGPQPAPQAAPSQAPADRRAEHSDPAVGETGAEVLALHAGGLVQAAPPAAEQSNDRGPAQPSQDEDGAWSPQEDDELRIEIARLLKPQSEAEERETLTLDQIADPQPEPAADDRAEDEAPLLLGTEDTPELASPCVPQQPVSAQPPATPEGAAPPARMAHPRIAESARRPQSAPAQPVQQARPVPASQSRAAQSPHAPVARAPQAQAATAQRPRTVQHAANAAPSTPRRAPRDALTDTPDGLPKCLTERWDGDARTAAGWSAEGDGAQGRDKGALRWPFRRLRATIDEDHAADRAEQSRRPSPHHPARTQATGSGRSGG